MRLSLKRASREDIPNGVLGVQDRTGPMDAMNKRRENLTGKKLEEFCGRQPDLEKSSSGPQKEKIRKTGGRPQTAPLNDSKKTLLFSAREESVRSRGATTPVPQVQADPARMSPKRRIKSALMAPTSRQGTENDV